MQHAPGGGALGRAHNCSSIQQQVTQLSAASEGGLARNTSTLTRNRVDVRAKRGCQSGFEAEGWYCERHQSRAESCIPSYHIEVRSQHAHCTILVPVTSKVHPQSSTAPLPSYLPHIHRLLVVLIVLAAAVRVVCAAGCPPCLPHGAAWEWPQQRVRWRGSQQRRSRTTSSGT